MSETREKGIRHRKAAESMVPRTGETAQKQPAFERGTGDNYIEFKNFEMKNLTLSLS